MTDQAIALRHGLALRLSGPGGLYNLGNALGLLSGVAFHVVAAGAVGVPSWAAARQYFVGSLGSLAITVAMLIFFWSGEQYHKAWAKGAPPDARLNRRGDISSGWGAMALGLGLFLMGQPVLAATAGLLHAIGKFGSALPERVQIRLPFEPGVFRRVVVASRLPALAAVVLEVWSALASSDGHGAGAGALLMLCYGLWLRADIALMRS